MNLNAALAHQFKRRGKARCANGRGQRRLDHKGDKIFIERAPIGGATDQALDRFATDVDVVTYEFENVPAETATFLAARVPVVPDPKILATTQDRLAEKEFVSALGIGVAPFP